jgi:hypothetical protein
MFHLYLLNYRGEARDIVINRRIILKSVLEKLGVTISTVGLSNCLL